MKLNVKFSKFKNISFASLAAKFHSADWKIPDIKLFYPHYISVIIGIVLATIVGLISAFVLMPQSSAARISGIDNEPAILKMSALPRENEFAAITKRNLFDSTSTGEDVDQQASCELIKSELPLKFTGVIFGGTAQTSLVLVETTADKRSDTFVLNDTIPGLEVRIVDIERKRLIVERNNCPEYIDLEELPLPKKRTAGVRTPRRASDTGALGGTSFREDGFEREGNSVKATRQWVEKAITVDFTKTLQDAKASPNVVNGQIKGFVLTRIKPDSIYEKMGLKDGDVVEAINGIELNDAARAISTLNAMKNESNIDLVVQRNGQTSTMNLQIR